MRPTAPSGRNMGCDHTRALDPDVLCEILKRVPDVDRLRSVPLVSLRLSQACRDPALWPDLRVQCADFQTEADWTSFLRWLVPRASGLQTLRFNDNEDERFEGNGGVAWALRVQDLMALLAFRAPQLQSLFLRYPASAQENATAVTLVLFPLADLQHLSQLTSLTLGLGFTPIKSAPLAAALRGLPALEHLGLTCTRCSWGECLVSVATSCPQLTCLQLESDFFCNDKSREQPNVPEEIGLLTNLVELTINTLRLTSLPDSISKLISLQRLLIADALGTAVELPSSLTACRQLSQLRILSKETSPVLADLKFLQQLEITLCSGVLPGEMFWPRLTGLTELKLTFGMGFDAAVLDGLVGMTGLQKLTLVYAEADILPEGPYLDTLEILSLQSWNASLDAVLPSNLAAATKLRHLELCGSHDVYERADLFFGVLESLQALETVHLSHVDDDDALTWNVALLQYRSRCSARGRSPVVITLT